MKELEREVMRFLKERNWDALRPSDLAKSIAIEAAELLELFQWNDATIAATKKDKDKLRKLRHELADVMIYCLEMAALLNLDTAEIIREKLALAREKYPVHLVRRSRKKSRNPGTEKIYLKIRDEYRRRGQ